MKKLAVIGFLTISALLAQPPGPPPGGRMGFGGRGPGFGPGGPGMQRTVTGAPYSGTEVSSHSQTLSNGNVISRQEQTNFSRDSQGRVRMETTMKHPDGTTATRVTIHDPVAGVVHNLDTQRKTSNDMTLHGPPNGQGRGRGQGQGQPRTGQHQADPNVVTESLGVQTINGVQATGTRITRTIPAGAEGNSLPIVTVHETWTSDDLKVPVMVKTTDPRFGASQTQLTNIVRAEPDPSLFQVPAGYTVTKDRGGMRGGPRSTGPGQQQ
jgi:hypothetical protein